MPRRHCRGSWRRWYHAAMHIPPDTLLSSSRCVDLEVTLAQSSDRQRARALVGVARALPVALAGRTPGAVGFGEGRSTVGETRHRRGAFKWEMAALGEDCILLVANALVSPESDREESCNASGPCGCRSRTACCAATGARCHHPSPRRALTLCMA